MRYSDFVRSIESDEVPDSTGHLVSRVRYLLDHPFDETLRLIRIQHALIAAINFIDPDSRWVPKNMRAKVDASKKL